MISGICVAWRTPVSIIRFQDETEEGNHMNHTNQKNHSSDDGFHIPRIPVKQQQYPRIGQQIKYRMSRIKRIS
jgi:hypothetical protein